MTAHQQPVLPPEIRMGNDIARQFAHLPEREAAEMIATHLEKFWEKRMLRHLLTIADPENPDIDPLLIHAVSCLTVDDVDHEELLEPSGG